MQDFFFGLIFLKRKFTEKRVEASISRLVLMTGKSFGILVEAGNVLHIGIGDIIIGSSSLGQDLTTNPLI